MDESLQELENELKRLCPRKPSARLLAAIEEKLAEPDSAKSLARAPSATKTVVWPWLNWRTSAAIAAVLAFAALLVTWRRPEAPLLPKLASQPIVATDASPVVEVSSGPALAISTDAPVADRYRPVGAASVLYDLREDSAASPQKTTNVRRLRYRYVDTYTWKNPATHASLKWSLPRDEVRVLPASLH